jgi:hypothetical protein
MTTEKKTTKTALKRITFMIGSIELDAYETYPGNYKLSVSQVAKAANLDMKRVPELWERKDVKAALGDSLKVPEFYSKTQVETAGGIRQANLTDLKYASLIWLFCGTSEGALLASACIMESLESRILEAKGEAPKTPEEREVIFHYRAAPVTIEKRKAIQKQLSEIYGLFCYPRIATIYPPYFRYDIDKRPEDFTDIGKEATIKINLAVFGQKHFKRCRTMFMDADSQAAIAEIEFHIYVLHFQKPLVDIMEHVETAILKHKNTYGERYFLEENKAPSSPLS